MGAMRHGYNLILLDHGQLRDTQKVGRRTHLMLQVANAFDYDVNYGQTSQHVNGFRFHLRLFSDFRTLFCEVVNTRLLFPLKLGARSELGFQ